MSSSDYTDRQRNLFGILRSSVLLLMCLVPRDGKASVQSLKGSKILAAEPYQPWDDNTFSNAVRNTYRPLL